MLSARRAYFLFTAALSRKLDGEYILIRIYNSFSLLTCPGKINVIYSMQELACELFM
jgi:hypothetical protein